MDQGLSSTTTRPQWNALRRLYSDPLHAILQFHSTYLDHCGWQCVTNLSFCMVPQPAPEISRDSSFGGFHVTFQLVRMIPGGKIFRFSPAVFPTKNGQNRQISWKLYAPWRSIRRKPRSGVLTTGEMSSLGQRCI